MSAIPRTSLDFDESESSIKYNEEEQAFTLDDRFEKRFASADNYTEVIGLYFFYYRTARWQKSHTLRLDMKSTEKGSGLSRDKITRVRKQLIKFGAIKIIKPKNKKGAFVGTYTQVMFHWKEMYAPEKPKQEPELAEKKPVFKRTNLPQSESNSSPTPDPVIKPEPKKLRSKLEMAQRYYPQAKRLSEIVMSHINKNITETEIRQWCIPIHALAKKGINTNRMDRLLDWYSENIGKEYVNVIHSGESFKNKFTDLEETRRRNEANYENRPRRRNNQSRHEVHIPETREEAKQREKNNPKYTTSSI